MQAIMEKTEQYLVSYYDGVQNFPYIAGINFILTVTEISVS